MGSATQQTIAEVKQRLAELDEEIADRTSERERVNQLLELLNEQFGNRRPPPQKRHRRAKKKSGSTETAKTQMHTWLKDHQGSAKKEIVAGTGLKHGTVGAYLSTEKDLFENRQGKWYAK